MKALSRLLSRRYPTAGGYTTEQARELAALSSTLNRQIGLLIDRQGRPYKVIVGDTARIVIPELPRAREGLGRLRGLRLLITHPHQRIPASVLRKRSARAAAAQDAAAGRSFAAQDVPQPCSAKASAAQDAGRASLSPHRTCGDPPGPPARGSGARSEQAGFTPAVSERSAKASAAQDMRPSVISKEELMDMLFLRLDGLSVLTVDEWGMPLLFQRAHLLPPNPDGETCLTYEPQRWDTVDTDFAAEIAALEEELARTAGGAGRGGAVAGTAKGADTALAGAEAASGAAGMRRVHLTGQEEGKGPESRAVLVGVSTQSRSEQESSLAELADLAATAGVVTVGTVIQRVRQVNPRYIIGKGKLAELEVPALQGNAGLIIFDGELSPAQLRNLTEITERRVLDRTQVILDIFARRASGKAGKIQVELAQLQYTLPRLAGKTRALDRLAGGIGGRGPGETKLETDRRRVRDRIARIKNELKELRRQRSYARSRRAKSNIPIASLVGYTNAGKSTLLNVLTGSEVLAENRLFATLDPTTRRLRFPRERELILTDTVGFIRSLPKELMEAFRATLEELEEADLLLHVADASHPELDMQLKAVDDILIQLELKDTPRLLVLNKMDALSDEQRGILAERHPDAWFISAVERGGLKELTEAVASRIDWDRFPAV